MNNRRSTYPFSAIVGQEKMKTALLLNAVNPGIGGVLIRGQKGTGKSLAVRALGRLLPEIEVVADCPFRCDPKRPEWLCDICTVHVSRGRLEVASRQVPVVELPVGATEDRVVGTLDIERAIKSGEKHFDPGLLAAANRGILYIDEVNLLDDHLVDVLLDAAASGVNVVEREGISFRHPTDFILVGTMNPEEGELRPQLLDRFGLAVEVKGVAGPAARAQIVRRRLAFEEDAVSFAASWKLEDEKLRQRITKARQLLTRVLLDDELLELITRICTDFAVDGHRADIVMHKAGLTTAALHGRTQVLEEDVREVAEMALLHRRRRQPFEEASFDQQVLQRSVQGWRESHKAKAPASPAGGDASGCKAGHDDPIREPPPGIIFEPGSPHKVAALTTPILDSIRRSESGRRSRTLSRRRTGRYVKSEVANGWNTDLAFDATLRAASVNQSRRRDQSIGGGSALLIDEADLRQKVRETRAGNLIMFILDGSGSMIAEERMVATKGTILSLLLDAYQRRDHVGLIIFRGDGAELVLPPTNCVELAQKCLRRLPAGGRTPLVHGLKLGMEVIKQHSARKRNRIPLLILVSDGKVNISLDGGTPQEEARSIALQIRKAHIRSICIDTEEPHRITGIMEDLSRHMGALYLRPEELKADHLSAAIREQLAGPR